MTTLRTAAQQALEALEYRDGDGADQWKADVITALRAALAQQEDPWPNCPSLDAQNTELDSKLAELEQAEPTGKQSLQVESVQEPVAWLYEAGTGRTLHWRKPPLYGTPLYTSPPKRLPLSGLEVERLLEHVIGSLPAARNLVRAVERAHGIIEPRIEEDSRQTLDDAMQQPRAMAQAYESGYKAGVAAEREACAQACEARFMGDMTREDMEARRCAAAIRARGEQP